MRVYRIAFLYQGKVYEVYAKDVRQGDLYGFLEISELIFEHSSELLVDPAEEKLRDEFAGVHRTLVPMHAVLRIDEVEKQGKGKIHELEKGSNVTHFPTQLFTPQKKPEN